MVRNLTDENLIDYIIDARDVRDMLIDGIYGVFLNAIDLAGFVSVDTGCVFVIICNDAFYLMSTIEKVSASFIHDALDTYDEFLSHYSI